MKQKLLTIVGVILFCAIMVAALDYGIAHSPTMQPTPSQRTMPDYDERPPDPIWCMAPPPICR